MFNGSVHGEGDEAGMMNGGSVMITESSHTMHCMEETEVLELTQKTCPGSLKDNVTDIWPPKRNPNTRVDERIYSFKSHGTSEEVSEGGVTTITTSTTEVSGGKSGMNYVKEMYAMQEGKNERRKEMAERIKRKPKQLDLSSKYAPDKPKEEIDHDIYHSHIQEQDVIAAHTIGLDYKKKKFESKSSSSLTTPSPSRSGRSPSPCGPPVNKQYIEKVAPPEITQSLRGQFERGEFEDTHKVRKLNPLLDLCAEGSVCESSPVQRSDVVRETDYNPFSGDDITKGLLKPLSERWTVNENGEEHSPTKQQISLTDLIGEAQICQNTPHIRSDVVRESDNTADTDVLEKGYTQALLKQWATPKEEKPEPKQRLILKELEKVEIDETKAKEYEAFKNERLQRLSKLKKNVLEDADKVTQSDLTKKIGAQYEKGEFYDEHTAKKTRLKDFHAEGGVSESTPQVRSDVVRESDQISGEELQKGFTKNLRAQWNKKGNEKTVSRKPIILNDLHAEGGVCESTPTVRSDVVRESDSTNGEELRVGITKSIRSQWGRKTSIEERKAPIVLNDLHAEGSVCESSPTSRTDVVRESDSNGGDELRVGYTKSIRAQWGRSSEERLEKKPPIVLKDLHAEGSVCENTPQARTDVFRETDATTGEELKKGFTKSIKEQWSRKSEERTEKKAIVLTDLHAEGAVCESTPQARTDVVRETDTSSGEELQKGYTKSIRKSWGQKSEQTIVNKQPIVLKDLHAEGSVCESSPVVRSDVFRETTPNPNGFNPGDHGKELQKGLTKSIRASWGRNSEERHIAKQPIIIKDPNDEGKVCESTPHMRTDVVRESDMNGHGGEELQQGFTKSRLQAYTTPKPNENKPIKSPINMDLAEGSVCESNPQARSDVIRESDQIPGEEFQKGFTKSRLQEYKRSNSQNENIPKQPISLDLAEGSVCESNPEQRTDVIRESDQTHGEVLQKGLTKSRLQEYTTVKHTEQVTKQPINMELAEGGICENNPQLRADVIRESDQTSGEVLHKGFTKSRLHEYTHVRSQENSMQKQPIHLDLAEGSVCESDPQLRTDVIRESDQSGGEELQKGFTKSRLHEFTQNKSQENTHKQPIHLDLAEGTVCESNPELRTDVVRESDQSGGEELQRGLLKSRMQEYTHVTSTSSSITQHQVQLDLAEGTVCESEPVLRTDVLRESDQSVGDALQKGFTKSRLQEFTSVKQTNVPTPKMPINLKDLQAEGAVCESTPQLRTDVIRETDQNRGEELEVGFTKSRLHEYTHANTENITTKQPIVIHGEGAVCENSPVIRSDVFRETTPNSNGFNPGEHAEELQKGLTKSRREEYNRVNNEENITPKQPIVLGIDGDGVVCENEPVIRSDVYCESTPNPTGEELQKGLTKSRLEEYTRVNTQDDKPKEPIVLKDLHAEGAVCESTPQLRTDVVRESDININSGDDLQKGFTKSRLEEYTRVSDNDKPTKQPIVFNDLLSEGAVCESTPQPRTDVVRESDLNINSGDDLQKGFTKSRLEEYTHVNNNEIIISKQPIAIHGEGAVCESSPVVRSDVFRETTPNPNGFNPGEHGVELQKGLTKSRREEYNRVNNNENKPTKQPIVFNDLLSEGAVCENTPQPRTDVVRESDEINNGDELEMGFTKSRLEEYSRVSIEQNQTIKEPIVLNDFHAEGAVCENTPQPRTDVVRESDQNINIELKKGSTKCRREEYTRVNNEEHKINKEPIILNDLHAEGAVCENTPHPRTDVVRESDNSNTGNELQKGFTKSRLEEFSQINTQQHITEKQPINLHDLRVEGSVCESVPQPRVDVVRESDTVDGDALQIGFTKSVRDQFEQGPEDIHQARTPIELRELCGEGRVCESEPQARADVIRETDINLEAESIKCGITRELLEQFAQDPDLEIVMEGGQAILRRKNSKEIGRDMNKVKIQHEMASMSLKDRMALLNDKPNECDNHTTLIRFTPPREVTPPPYMNGERRPSGASYEPCVFMQNGMVPKGELPSSVPPRATQNGIPGYNRKKKKIIKRTGPAKPIPRQGQQSPMSPTQPPQIPQNGVDYDDDSNYYCEMNGQSHITSPVMEKIPVARFVPPSPTPPEPVSHITSPVMEKIPVARFVPPSPTTPIAPKTAVPVAQYTETVKSPPVADIPPPILDTPQVISPHRVTEQRQHTFVTSEPAFIPPAIAQAESTYAPAPMAEPEPAFVPPVDLPRRTSCTMIVFKQANQTSL